MFRNMLKKKKAQIQGIGLMSIGLVIIAVIVGFGVGGIVSAYTVGITADIRSDMTEDSLEYNVTTKVLEGQSKLTDKFPMIGTVIAAVIILGILVGGFMIYKGKQ
jgi:hypothetical protein